MKNKTVIITIVVLFVVAVGVGAFFGLNSRSGGSSIQAPVTASSSSAVESTSLEGYSGKLIAGSTTPYLRYNEADFKKTRSEGKAVYLYFYATWCPICVVERPKILNAFDGLDLKDAVGFEAHWSDGQNTEADDSLARDYGVASQHTHIFIGKDGNVIEKTLAGLSSDDIRMKLSEAAVA